MGDDETQLNEDASSPLTEQLVGLMAAVEQLASLAVATGAYRAKLEESGFSPTASEVMSMDFHRALVIAALTPAMATGKPRSSRGGGVRHRFIDWSPLRPPTQWWPESMTVAPLDESGVPVGPSTVTFPLRGRCASQRYGDSPALAVRCERHVGHPSAHWAYGRGTW